MATSHKKKNEEGSSWEEDDMQILEGGQQRRLQKEEGGGRRSKLVMPKSQKFLTRVESNQAESSHARVELALFNATLFQPQ